MRELSSLIGKVALFGDKGGGGGGVGNTFPYRSIIGGGVGGGGGEVGLDGKGAPDRREVIGDGGTAFAMVFSIC